MVASATQRDYRVVTVEQLSPSSFMLLEYLPPHCLLEYTRMPIFEYVCNQCHHGFEMLVFGRDKASCPKCKSKDLAPQLSVFAVAAKGGTASPSGPSACGSCGDPRGPGSCSLPDMD